MKISLVSLMKAYFTDDKFMNGIKIFLQRNKNGIY